MPTFAAAVDAAFAVFSARSGFGCGDEALLLLFAGGLGGLGGMSARTLFQTRVQTSARSKFVLCFCVFMFVVFLLFLGAKLACAPDCRKGGGRETPVNISGRDCRKVGGAPHLPYGTGVRAALT
jgi:hypothetical protein